MLEKTKYWRHKKHGLSLIKGPLPIFPLLGAVGGEGVELAWERDKLSLGTGLDMLAVGGAHD